jgi:hypothetical protein
MSEYINNSEQRKETLKQLILDLHGGADLEDVRERFRRLVGDISAVELARLEQELIDEGLPAEEVKELCDVHVAVFQEALEGEAAPEMTPGHPVHTLKAENFAVNELLKLLEETMPRLPDEAALKQARAYGQQLGEIRKIYSRKENLLFPILESRGVTGPSSVMWAQHDEIRGQLKAFQQALQEADLERAREVFEPMAEDMRQMFYKEEHILYPTALKILNDADWAAIRDQGEEIGYCLVRPGDQWEPEVSAEESDATMGTTGITGEDQIRLDTGILTAEQVNLMLKNLPVDITFVDENDTVRYFSQTPERIFTRTEAIIGRNVQNCHPPHSVHVVNQLLDEMKAGKRDVAEFWIPMEGMFVHIRYFALREEDGTYRGCIEVTQNIAPIQEIEGEKRLMDEAEE